MRGLARIDLDAIDRALQTCHLTDLAHRPAASLSGGQLQRCWIAMILAQDTPVLLPDEPTTFLDLVAHWDLMALLSHIRAEDGRSIVMVLHELNLAAAFADTIVMMESGQVLHSGAPVDMLSPDRLRDAFDLNARVIAHPDTGRPVCLPHRDARQGASL
ncbi:MAG: ABC transporter ATP-binding protein [Pseudomonadota bacterium]